MSKLLSFKKYLTFDDAAEQLSGLLAGEKVTSADIEHLAREGHLRVSVIARNWVAYPVESVLDDAGQPAGFICRKDGRPSALVSGVYPLDLWSAFQPAAIEGPGLPLELDGSPVRCFEIVEAESHVAGDRLPLGQHRRPSTELESLVIQPGDLLAFANQANNHKGADDTPKKSHLLLIAALLDLLKEPVANPRPNGRKQEAIKDEILDKFPLRGLGKRNVENILGEANRVFEDARKE